jgi:hypothetical protein
MKVFFRKGLITDQYDIAIIGMSRRAVTVLRELVSGTPEYRNWALEQPERIDILQAYHACTLLQSTHEEYKKWYDSNKDNQNEVPLRDITMNEWSE